jgi:hypothetical protein
MAAGFDARAWSAGTVVNTNNDASAIALPYVYGKWVGQLLEDSIPQELAATCDSCAMCFHEEDKPVRQGFYFNPAIKCCTYCPELPNFLVGAILSNEAGDNASGRVSVTRRLTAGVGVTPLGVFPSPSFTLLYRNSPAAFGRSQSLSCPYYETQTGRCGIWQYRAPPCATWFCKHNRGAVGRNFWRELNLLLMDIQQSVAVWCMARLDVDIEAMHTVLNEFQTSDTEFNISSDILDGAAEESRQRSVWGSWYGRQQEYYQRCARLVESLEWQNIQEVCGPEVQVRAQIVKVLHRKLTSSDFPTRLRVGGYQVVDTSEDYVRVTTYSPYDPLDIPKSAMDALAYFDGRPLTEAVTEITAELNMPINSKALCALLDFGVLEEEPEDSISNLDIK